MVLKIYVENLKVSWFLRRWSGNRRTDTTDRITFPANAVVKQRPNFI